ncbi:MAG: class I SAM-dependent methyltransferase [Pyrobaculum sp.]
MIWLVALAAALVILHVLWPYLLKRGAAYSTSSVRAVEWAFSKVGVAGKKVYDLGCGYGRVLVIAKKMGAVAVGVEIDPVRWFICKLRCLCRVVRGDMYNINLVDADVVYIFQWPTVNKKLAEKFRKELKPGAYVISYMWPVPGLLEIARNDELKIYIYRV